MSFFNNVSAVVGALSASVALVGGISALTSTARHRKREEFYRNAAKYESSQRSQILMSLRRESVARVIANEAVSVGSFIAPVLILIAWWAELYLCGQGLVSDLLAGRSIADPIEGPIASLITTAILGQGLVLPALLMFADALRSRRRLIEIYVRGIKSLTYQTSWRHMLLTVGEDPQNWKPKLENVEVGLPEGSTSNMEQEMSTVWWKSLEFKLLAVVIGTGAQATLVSLLIGESRANRIVVSHVFTSILLLVGMAGLLAVFWLLISLWQSRLDRPWSHPRGPRT